MPVRLVQALRNTAIFVLFAVGFVLVYALIVGRLGIFIGRTSYEIDSPTEIRLTALLLIFAIFYAIRLLWRGRKSIG